MHLKRRAGEGRENASTQAVQAWENVPKLGRPSLEEISVHVKIAVTVARGNLHPTLADPGKRPRQVGGDRQRGRRVRRVAQQIAFSLSNAGTQQLLILVLFFHYP